MAEKEDTYKVMRHGGTVAAKNSTPPGKKNVFRDPVTKRVFFTELPDGFKLASKEDFVKVRMWTPYLVLSEVDGTLQAYRVGACFPWDDFNYFLTNNKVYIKKKDDEK